MGCNFLLQHTFSQFIPLLFRSKRKNHITLSVGQNSEKFNTLNDSWQESSVRTVDWDVLLFRPPARRMSKAFNTALIADHPIKCIPDIASQAEHETFHQIGPYLAHPSPNFYKVKKCKILPQFSIAFDSELPSFWNKERLPRNLKSKTTFHSDDWLMFSHNLAQFGSRTFRISPKWGDPLK